MKNDITKRLRDRFNKTETIEPTVRGKSYHRFFEGYSEVKQDGKILRIYTGKLYIRQGSARSWIGEKLCVAFLFLLSAVFYVVTAMQPVRGNSTWFVALAGMWSLFFYVLALWSLLIYLGGRRMMTIWEYTSGVGKLGKRCILTACGLFATGVLDLLNSVLFLRGYPPSEHLWALGYLAAGTILFLIRVLLVKSKYHAEDNEQEAPEGGSLIQ